MTLDADSSSEGPGFKENFAQIGVYFQSLNTKLVQEEPKYTVSIDSGHFIWFIVIYKAQQITNRI